MTSVLANTARPELVVVVADRCTDRSPAIADELLTETPSVVVEKNSSSWRNSISENLQFGLSKAIGDALVIVDADITVSPKFLETLLSQLPGYAVVSAVVRTDPSQGLLNRLVALWELTYALTPFEDQPRGGARAISIKALNDVGGFRDVYAWESDLDNRLRGAGFRVRLDRRVSVLHHRRMTLTRSIAYQIKAGRARKELGVSSVRTLLHSIIRMRPFVIVGYLSQ